MRSNTIVPFDTKTEERPSAPPPRGRIVSLLATRELVGATGYSRRAVLEICQRP